MTHGEREAKLLVRVARLEKDASRVFADLENAGLMTTGAFMQAAVFQIGLARAALMVAIRKAGEAAGRKR